jgi:O-antigen/teichoic acid export membrane protein
MLMGVFAEPAVRLWTGNPMLAVQVAPLIKILAIGTALHGVMYFQFALQLSYGLPRLALDINLILMTVLVPLIIILAITYGAYGGAIAWLVLHFLYITVGTRMTHRRVLRDVPMKWLIEGLGLPIVATALVAVPATYAARLHITPVPKLAIGLALGVVAVFLCRLFSPYSWAETKAELHR